MVLAHHAGYGRQIHVVDQRAERAEDGYENNKYDIVAAVERSVGCGGLGLGCGDALIAHAGKVCEVAGDGRWLFSKVSVNFNIPCGRKVWLNILTILTASSHLDTTAVCQPRFDTPPVVFQ